MGIRAISNEGSTSHVTIRDNRISLLRANDGYALQVNGDDILVDHNTVVDCQRAVGIMAGGNRVIVRNNFVSRTSRQGIWFMGIENGEILNNRVTDIRGTHSNGISVYLYHKNILMAGNRVWNTNIAMTYHGDQDPDFVNNLIVYNNFFANDVHSWGKGMCGVTILNNTFLEGIFFPSEDQEVVFINNVVNGGGGGDVRSHNVYIGLTWSQQPRYGWEPGPGGIVGWDPEEEKYVPIVPETVLVDPTGDYRLQPDSPAIDAGTDVTAYLPAPGEFSYAGFGADIDRTSRPYGVNWDMGASEFTPALDLFARPGDRTIYLDWTVNATDMLPVSITWHIDYYTRMSSIHTVTGIVSPTRAYTLTGLTNDAWYTVTLNGMLDAAPFLTDTVRVMPAGAALQLDAAPGDGEAYLTWGFDPVPATPFTGTWRIGYESDTGTLLMPPIEISTATVRAWTLTGLANGVRYTVTLEAMLDASPWLSDTVRVMPTDRFVYLPLVLRGR